MEAGVSEKSAKKARSSKSSRGVAEETASSGFCESKKAHLANVSRVYLSVYRGYPYIAHTYNLVALLLDLVEDETISYVR
jgi:hypothetical protein